jgi:D-alanyl-D-alanine dipeptidase
MHNRGLAIDLTLADASGNPLEMGTDFDFFGPEAAFAYSDLPEKTRFHRQKLRALMEGSGFRGIRSEWWHFSFQTVSYPLDSMQWACPQNPE